jgi:hypothetical protein
MPADPDLQLFHVAATLTEPETLEGAPSQFDDTTVAAINDRKPAAAVSWDAELRAPMRCVLHADIEALTGEIAAYTLLTDLGRALLPLTTRPRNVEVRVDKIRVEVSYLP